jgi:plasmid maintenance system antidote protein VapI
MVTLGTLITNKLRENGKTATDIAKDFNVKPPYIFQVIHGKNKSWAPKAMKIRLAIADLLHTVPEQLWTRPTKKKSDSNVQPVNSQ